jgi:hypothetical protein
MIPNREKIINLMQDISDLLMDSDTTPVEKFIVVNCLDKMMFASLTSGTSEEFKQSVDQVAEFATGLAYSIQGEMQ